MNTMLIPSTQKTLGVHEHIFRNKEGELFLVRFEVREIDGKIRGRIIEVTPVATLQGDCSSYSNCLRLQGGAQPQVFSSEIFYTKEVISPYSNFDFLVSQMTRAPALTI